jgi:hypothetical protein
MLRVRIIGAHKQSLSGLSHHFARTHILAHCHVLGVAQMYMMLPPTMTSQVGCGG